MTGYRRAYGRSRTPRRYVPWPDKSILPGAVQENIILGIKDESEIAVVGTPHGIFFSRSIRRVPEEDSGDGMLLNSITGAPWELQPGAEGGVVNRVQLDVQAGIPERSPTADSRGTVAKTILQRAISGIGEVRGHRRVYRVPTCEIGFEAGGSQRGMPCQDCQAHDR